MQAVYDNTEYPSIAGSGLGITNEKPIAELDKGYNIDLVYSAVERAKRAEQQEL